MIAFVASIVGLFVLIGFGKAVVARTGLRMPSRAHRFNRDELRSYREWSKQQS